MADALDGADYGGSVAGEASPRTEAVWQCADGSIRGAVALTTNPASTITPKRFLRLSKQNHA